MQINQYKSYHLHQKFKAGSKYSSRALQNNRSQKLGMSKLVFVKYVPLGKPSPIKFFTKHFC